MSRLPRPWPCTLIAIGLAVATFLQAMADHQELLADAEKAWLEIMPVSGEEVQKLVAELHATPDELVRKVADTLNTDTLK